jgi:hypothetical protein
MIRGKEQARIMGKIRETRVKERRGIHFDTE